MSRVAGPSVHNRPNTGSGEREQRWTKPSWGQNPEAASSDKVRSRRLKGFFYAVDCPFRVKRRSSNVRRKLTRRKKRTRGVSSIQTLRTQRRFVADAAVFDLSLTGWELQEFARAEYKEVRTEIRR